MNKFRKLTVVLFLSITVMFVVSVSGYAQPKVQKCTPLPLQAEGWEGVAVSHVCLKVEQSYPQIEDEFSQPIAETAQQVLRRLGVQAVGEGEPCDATLTFTLTLKARVGDYRGVRLYTGADAEGRLELLGKGRPSLSFPVSQSVAPPYIVTYRPTAPQDAPFDRVWRLAILDGLVELWGIQAIIEGGLRDEHFRVRQYAAAALGRIGDARAVEPLIAALKNERNFQARRSMVRALGEIGDARVVEPLIAVLKDEHFSVRGRAAGALREITGKNFGEDLKKWQEWFTD